MKRTYSEIRDMANEVIASVMTATPLGSNASIEQLGATRRKIVGTCAELIADEVVKMFEDDSRWKMPSDRYDRNENNYSEPGKYDDKRELPKPAKSSKSKDWQKGMFEND